MKNRAKNRVGRRLAFFLTVVLTTAGTLTPSAFVQINPKPNQLPQKPPQHVNTNTASSVTITRPPTKINPQVIRANARAPIAFKQLEMVNPRTGKPVTGNTMLTLDDGRTINAAKYYEQMNKLEQGLNKFGYSFRDQQKEVVIGEAFMDKAKTLSQIKSMRFTTPNPKAAAQLEVIAQNHRAYVRAVNPYFGKLPPKGAAGKVNRGLFRQNVGATVVNPGSIATSTASSGYTPKKRPDFVPGDSAVTGLNSDVETLPGINLDPGLAQAGKRASALQINAAWSNVGFYVNYLSASTAPLAPKYVWQVVKARPSLDNFGAFGKAWPKEFGGDELSNWKTPPGLIGSVSVSFLNMRGAPSKREHLFLIDFGKLVGAPPTKPGLYLVRVIPVNADGSIGGYPSRPVLVSYGAEDPPKIVLPKYVPPPPFTFPVNHLSKDAPNSFGDPSVMSLELKSWMNSTGSLTHESAEIGFDGGCSVLGQPFSLLRITAHGEVDARQVDSAGKTTLEGKVSGKISYLVLGQLLPCDNCDQTDTAHVSFPAGDSIPLNEGFTFGFPVGPIDVSATIGFRGTIGFGGNVSLATDALFYPVVLEAGPYVSAHVYLEAGAGIGVGGFDVASAGVGGEVNLITAGFVVGIRIGNGPQGPSQYYGRISELRVLDGRLYAWAKAGICPFCKKWERTLWDWAGGYDMQASDPGKMTLFEGPL